MFYVLRPGVYFIPIYIYRDTNASTSSMCEYTVYLSNEHHKVLQVRQCLRRHQSRSATRSYHSVHKHKERPLELHPPLDSAKISWRRKYSSHVFRGFFFILLSFWFASFTLPYIWSPKKIRKKEPPTLTSLSFLASEIRSAFSLWLFPPIPQRNVRVRGGGMGCHTSAISAREFWSPSSTGSRKVVKMDEKSVGKICTRHWRTASRWRDTNWLIRVINCFNVSIWERGKGGVVTHGRVGGGERKVRKEAKGQGQQQSGYTLGVKQVREYRANAARYLAGRNGDNDIEDLR